MVSLSVALYLAYRELTRSTPTQAALPRFSHILELCLYCKSLNTSVAWYRNVLRLKPHFDNSRMAVFALGTESELILFQRGLTHEDSSLGSNGVVPGHGPPPDSDVKLKTHFCLAVDSAEDVMKWKDELESKGTTILGEVTWPEREGRQGRSVYFSDPDGHVGEVASRGIWPNY